MANSHGRLNRRCNEAAVNRAKVHFTLSLLAVLGQMSKTKPRTLENLRAAELIENTLESSLAEVSP